MPKLIYLIALCILLVSTTGCFKRTEQSTEVSTEEENFPVISNTEELDKARGVLFDELSQIPSSKESYQRLRKLLIQYGRSSAVRDDALTRLIQLQEVLKLSPLYTVDFDEDGAIDIYELLLYNTNPLATNSSKQKVKDGKLATYVNCFIFPNGKDYIITDPVISPFMEKALQVGTITSDTFIRINIRLYADEVKSLVIGASSSSSFSFIDAKTFPIAVMISGLKNLSTQGNIYYYHKNLGRVENSSLAFLDTVTGLTGTDQYLERSKEYTSTQNVIYMNRVNILAFLDNIN